MIIKLKSSCQFKSLVLRIIFISLFFDALLPAYALQKNSSVSSALGKEVFPASAYLLQAAVSLLLIISIVFIIFLYLRRFGGSEVRRNEFIKIVSVFALSTRDKLLIMQISNVYLLLAVSPGNIQLLHKFDENFEPLTNVKGISEMPHQHPQFIQYFMDALSRGKKI